MKSLNFNLNEFHDRYFRNACWLSGKLDISCGPRLLRGQNFRYSSNQNWFIGLNSNLIRFQLNILDRLRG